MTNSNDELIKAFKLAKELLGFSETDDSISVSEITDHALEQGLLTKEEHEGIHRMLIYKTWPKS